MFYQKINFTIFVLLLLTNFSVHANTAERELANLTLDQAIEKALKNNFDLSALELEADKAQARTFQVSRLPNPELSVEVENFGGSGELRQSDAIETTVMVNQPFLLGGKRSKQKKVSLLDEKLTNWDLQSQRLEIIKEVHNAFVDVLGAQELVKLNIELVDLEKEVFRSVKERVKAGKVSPIEEIKAKANLDAEMILFERAERSLFSAKRRLCALWGDSLPYFKEVSADITALKDLPDFDVIQSKAIKNPDLARWSTEMEKRKLSLNLEKAKRLPDVEIGVGWRDFNESDDHAFLAGITVPLPLFDRNRGSVREAVHDISKAEKEKRSAELSVNTELWSVYNEIKVAYSEASGLKNTVLPSMKKVLEAQQEGYRRGKFDYLEVLDAQRSFFENRRNLLNSLVSYHKGIADIKRLIGGVKIQDIFDNN